MALSIGESVRKVGLLWTPNGDRAVKGKGATKSREEAADEEKGAFWGPRWWVYRVLGLANRSVWSVEAVVSRRPVGCGMDGGGNEENRVVVDMAQEEVQEEVEAESKCPALGGSELSPNQQGTTRCENCVYTQSGRTLRLR